MYYYVYIIVTLLYIFAGVLGYTNKCRVHRNAIYYYYYADVATTRDYIRVLYSNVEPICDV